MWMQPRYGGCPDGGQSPPSALHTGLQGAQRGPWAQRGASLAPTAARRPGRQSAAPDVSRERSQRPA
eukprot:CAMPEP_0116955918 /NCGR_PEP_ID=MMETSP0467-20121206/42964_1 /TAXON_ID=283647 /ORGANISM="Mesodinium pulex, Strain SPMC105" /LENGTH=66 /DNA_ID=CAMNT_0004642173 /DNA_START=83 /DNA_END=279 /DNA_ORIENTATION=+